MAKSKRKKKYNQHSPAEREAIIQGYMAFRAKHPSEGQHNNLKAYAKAYSKKAGYNLSVYTLAGWYYDQQSHTQEDRNAILEDYKAYRNANFSGDEDETRKSFCASYTAARRAEDPTNPSYELSPDKMKKWEYKKVTPKVKPKPHKGPKTKAVVKKKPTDQIVHSDFGITFCTDCASYYKTPSEETDICLAKLIILCCGTGAVSFVRAKVDVDRTKAFCLNVNTNGACKLFSKRAIIIKENTKTERGVKVRRQKCSKKLRE